MGLYISEFGRKLIKGPRTLLQRQPGPVSTVNQGVLTQLRARLGQESGILAYSPDQPRAADGKFGSGDEDDTPVKYKLSEGVRRSDAKNMPEDPTWKQHKDWKQQAYGGIIVNSKNRFLLREPTGHFDGYTWTWPKGKMDNPGEHPVDTTVREVAEETGRHARIFDTLPGNYKSGSGSNSNFYLMRNMGFDKSLMDKETKNTRWADYKEAKDLISQSKNKAGRARDLAILEKAHEHLQNREIKSAAEDFVAWYMEGAAGFNEADHPRDNTGKFTTGGDTDLSTKKGVHEHLTNTGWTLVKSAKGLIPGKEDNPTKVGEYTHPLHGKMWVGPNNFYHQKPNGVEKNNIQKMLVNKFGSAAPTIKTPTLTPQETNKVIEQATTKNPYTPGGHVYELASQIPVGMHSEYSKTLPDGPKWEAKFNPATGNYDKFMNGEKKGQGTDPALLAKQLTSQTIPYKPVTGAVAGIKPAGQAPATAQVQSKPTSPSPTTPKGAEAELAAKIPSGMHSSYTKVMSYGTNWHAKFNSVTGNYQKLKGTKSSGSVTPEVLQNQIAKEQAQGGKSYQPDKSAVAGTGPRVAKTEPTPVAQPKATEPVKPEFTYKGSGSQLGGAHEKHIFTDKDGKDWMFKPATTLSGGASPITAHAEEMASKIQQKVTPDAAVEVKAVTLNVPGKGEQFGSIQKLIPDAKSSVLPSDAKHLAPEDVKQLQQAQVFDWLTSNHDSHAGQFIQTTDGKIVGIDKGQAFRYFPKDQLSSDYKPNTINYGEKQPYYNDMWAAVKSGKLNFDPQDALPAIKNAEKISDTDYKKMLDHYAESRFGSAPDQKEKFLNDAVDRKNNLKSDFEKFYSGILGKDFKFDESHLYSQKPEGVSQAAHQALEDAGFKFEKTGQKTGWPLYKDPSGKAIYVADEKTNKFEYYPMGTHGGNTYGSTKSEGLDTLKKTLAEPFEKPEAAQPAYTAPASTSTYTPSYGLTPEQKTAEASVPSIDFSPGHGSSTPQHVAGPQNYSSAEKGSVGAYKGSTYHSINGWLYSGKDANLNDHVKNINSAMEKGFLKADTVLYRGLKSGYATEVKAQLLNGIAQGTKTQLEPKCFQSTSTSQDFSHDWGTGGVILKINAPAGTKAISVDKVQGGHGDSEKEIILGHDVKYNVDKVYKSGGKLYAEVTVEAPYLKQKKVAAATKSDKFNVKEYADKIRALKPGEDPELAFLEVYQNGVKTYPKE